MASISHSTPASAQQPGLRSFIIYNELPEGCIAFEVPDDKAWPHLAPGEFVVLDPADRDPVDGELFVITWKSDILQRRKIVRMDLRKRGRGGMPADQHRNSWLVGAVAPQRRISLAGQPIGKPMRWIDGPFGDVYCREICQGRIIGIYEPDFRRQLAKAN